MGKAGISSNLKVKRNDFVPLTGIAGITVVISGYILWRRKYRKQGYKDIS
jgi:hypothetical protein